MTVCSCTLPTGPVEGEPKAERLAVCSLRTYRGGVDLVAHHHEAPPLPCLGGDCDPHGGEQVRRPVSAGTVCRPHRAGQHERLRPAPRQVEQEGGLLHGVGAQRDDDTVGAGVAGRLAAGEAPEQLSRLQRGAGNRADRDGVDEGDVRERWHRTDQCRRPDRRRGTTSADRRRHRHRAAERADAHRRQPLPLLHRPSLHRRA